MLLINYDIDTLPKTNDISLYTVHFECPYDQNYNLDWVQERGQIVSIVICCDGLAVFVREIQEDKNPWYHVQKLAIRKILAMLMC